MECKERRRITSVPANNPPSQGNSTSTIPPFMYPNPVSMLFDVDVAKVHSATLVRRGFLGQTQFFWSPFLFLGHLCYVSVTYGWLDDWVPYESCKKRPCLIMFCKNMLYLSRINCLLGVALICKRNLQSHVLISCRWRPAPIVPFNHQVQFFPEHSFYGCNVHYVHSIWTDLFPQYWCCSERPVPVISQSLHKPAVGSLMFKSRLHPAEVYQNLCPEGTWIENIAFRQSKLIASRVHTR